MQVTCAVFTYGTLMFQEIMEAVTGQRFSSYAGTAEGYNRFRLQGKIYPGLVREAGTSTQGYVYVNVNEGALWYVDQFEDQVYVRRSISVRHELGQCHSAYAYVIPEESRMVLTSEKWSHTEFLAHHFHEYLKRCQAFHLQMSQQDNDC